LLALAIGAALIAVNTWLYLSHRLVLPLAAALLMTALAFVLNANWGYFVETRTRRGLARLFGTYVPPQLVDEMLADPGRYSMRAESKELTVMFCDMRGFTSLSEQMTPAELQTFLHQVFSRLTAIINAHRGTVDKYMGDCVMAFWGAPVDMPDHAALAVRAAIDMVAAMREINQAHRAGGRPPVGVGIGLNTGIMSVGDMGSDLRRSYTVVGDAVNLASRLESLSGHYGVDVVATAATQQLVPAYQWQELDRVIVKGRAQAVTIFTPLVAAEPTDPQQQDELACWQQLLRGYRAQDWASCEALIGPLIERDAKKVLYRVYAQRIASMKLLPKTPDWDGATRFDSK
jgi:adenylate cyclase